MRLLMGLDYAARDSVEPGSNATRNLVLA